MRSSLTDDSAKTLVHAFVSRRLDYCNSVLYSVSGRLLRKLQTVQNAAARCNAVKKVRPHHASAERAPLAAHGTACAVQAGANCFQVPPWPGTVYLTDDCVFVSSVAGRRPLQSADTRTLYVPLTRSAIGARIFAATGPCVWNSLPPELRMLNCTVCTFAVRRNNNNNDRLTAFDPGQPG